MSERNLPLDVLQGWMQNALVFPRSADPGETEKIVEASPRLTGAQRLGIYQRSYYLRLLNCMDDQFPALRHALGEELFTQFAREYLQALPSESYTLHDLGRRFPGFLEETRPDRDKGEDERETWANFMVNLARCERDLFVMFDAPGHEGKPYADDQVPDERLRLQPCFALHEYRFPVSAYYHQVQQGKEPQLPPKETSYVALVRRDYHIRTFPLHPTHHFFLKSMADGRSAADALEVVAARSSRSAGEVSRAWSSADGKRKRWIEAGFFIDAKDVEPSEGAVPNEHTKGPQEKTE